jgi:Holliday junction DNA helicase RuvA
MIAALTGRLASRQPSTLTLDVQGVGYEVFIPLSTFYALPDSNELVSLSVYTHLREDAIQLFGFLTPQEKEAFILLIGISGIGPKLALSVLSALSVPDFVSAVQAGDVEKLATVPGIGKKSAARIALELKEKVSRLTIPGQSCDAGRPPDRLDAVREDALSALVNLGYRPADVRDSLKRLERIHPGPRPLEELIRDVLKELARSL